MRALAERDAAETRPEPPFRTYGLAAPGLDPPALAETEQVDGVWRSVVLTHGDWSAPAGPLVRVATRAPEPGQPDRGACWDLLRALEQERDRAVEHCGVAQAEPERPPEFAAVSVWVDGELMSGLLARQADLWAARVPVAELTLLIVGRGIEPDLVRLAAVAGLAPYWQGRDEMIGLMAARERERPEAVLAPADGAEAFRALIEVTLADGVRLRQALAENRAPRSEGDRGLRRALWQRAVEQQALRSGSDRHDANDLVTLIVNLVGHLQEEATWFAADPVLREDAIDETLRYHLFSEDVTSRAAQEAWRRYWLDRMRSGGGDLDAQFRRLAADHRAGRAPGWLEAWNGWARSR